MSEEHFGQATLLYERLMFDGDQIGFIVDDKCVEIYISDEDMENAEISDEKAARIRAAIPSIVEALESSGYTVDVDR